MKLIEFDTSFKDEDTKASKQLKVTCQLNEAACELKLKNYPAAARLTTKVGIVKGCSVWMVHSGVCWVVDE